MFINCTNHPYAIWSEAQREASAVYGEVVDMPFPSIPPDLSVEDIRRLAGEYAEKIEEKDPLAVAPLSRIRPS